MCMQTPTQTTGPGAGPQPGTRLHTQGSQKSRESQQPESGRGRGGVRQKSRRWNFGVLSVFENWSWGLPIILGYGGKVSIQWDQTGRRGDEGSRQPWSEHHQMSQVRVGDSRSRAAPAGHGTCREDREVERAPSLPAVMVLGAQLWGSRTRSTAGPLLPPRGHQGKGGELSLRFWTGLGPWVSSVTPVSPHLSPLEEQTRAPGLASSYYKCPSGLRILALGLPAPLATACLAAGVALFLQEAPA